MCYFNKFADNKKLTRSAFGTRMHHAFCTQMPVINIIFHRKTSPTCRTTHSSDIIEHVGKVKNS